MVIITKTNQLMLQRVIITILRVIWYNKYNVGAKCRHLMLKPMVLVVTTEY